MKRAVLVGLIILPLSVFGQQSSAADPTPSGTIATSVTFPVERVRKPTNADLYCAGFVSKSVSTSNFVGGGLDSPFTTQFGSGEAVFLKGKGYEVGQEYTIVRELKDPNRYELFPGQWAAVKAAGQPYSELARVKIVDTRSKMAVGYVEFSCDTVLPGDYAIPFVEKTTIASHPQMRFDRSAHDSVESISFNSPAMEPTQTRQPSVNPTFLSKTNGPETHTSEMPLRAVGEIVIIGTTPTTATGMVVYSLEPVHLGDRVELDQQ